MSDEELLQTLARVVALMDPRRGSGGQCRYCEKSPVNGSRDHSSDCDYLRLHQAVLGDKVTSHLR